MSFERLLREVEVQKQLYITLKKEFELAYIEEVEDSDFFYVLDSPEEPLNRSKPKRKLIVILSSMFGLGLGLIGAFVKNWYLEQKKDNIRKKGEIISLSTFLITNILEKLSVRIPSRI